MSSGRTGTAWWWLTRRLAHNERPGDGQPGREGDHSSGRADKVDRDALARLVSSISRFPRPEQAVAAVQGAEIEVLDSRRLGAAWTGA